MGANADLVGRWFEEVWNQGNLDAIEEMLAPGAVMHGLAPGEISGRQAFRAFHANFCATFSDIHVSIERSVEEGDSVASWCEATAIHRESGTKVAFSGAVMGTVRDGMLQEGWNSWDFLGLLAQIGAVDAAAVAPLLGADPGEATA